jgi:membrane glycosyltransferase
MLRRLVLLMLVLLGAFVGTRAMAEVLPEGGAALAERGLLLLFGILFAWISAGFWTGLMGAGAILLRPGRSPLTRGLGDAALRPLDAAARTAVVMPICNEHVPTVFGGLAATIDSLVATGEAGNFDVYVLSDTSDPDIRAAEQSAWSALAARLTPSGEGEAPAIAVHYRWRQRRVKRKAGNVADFCRRWGAGYRYLVVLDADSVMTGECLTTLVRMRRARSVTRRCTPEYSSSRRAPTGRSSPPACASGSSASRTTGATTRSCAWRPSWPTARSRLCPATARSPAR